MAALLPLALTLSAGTLIATGVFALIALRRAAELLEANGYYAFLGLNEPSLLLFLLSCFRNSTCAPNLNAAWAHFYPTWLPLAFLASLVLLVVAYVLHQHAKHPHIDLATGRWSTKRDLKRAGYLQNPRDPHQRGYVGLHPCGKMLRVPEQIRFSHTLVLGGPGARKSTGYHWQNILSDANDGWSVIILDLKYPDPSGGFVSVLPYFEKRGYNIYAFTPYDDVTYRLPIIRDASNERVAREISEMVIAPGEDGNASFYRNNERRILAGLLMHAADNGLSITDLHTVCQQGPSGVRSFVNGKDLHDGKPSDLYKTAGRQPLALLQVLFDAEPKDQTGFLAGIEGKLQFFADTRLGNATRMGGDTWTQIDLNRIGTEKTLLYVGLPQKNIDSGSGKLLLQLIKRLIDSALSETAYTHQGAVPVPVSFYLDEFPSLGKLPNVESNFATMRSRRVAYHLTIQNISQGKAIYGQDAFKSFFTSNFQTIMLFPSFIKFEDAKYISQILGDTMTTVEGYGNTRGGEYRSLSENWRESTRPLVTIDEMQTWPHDEAIVILNGVPHTRVLVPGIWEDSVRNRRNPFKAAYDSLDHRMDAQAYITHLIQEGRGLYQRAKLADLRREAHATLKATNPQHTQRDYAPAPGIQPPEPEPPTEPSPTSPPTPNPTPTAAPTTPAATPPTPQAPAAANASESSQAPAATQSDEQATPPSPNTKRVLTRLVQNICEARASVRVVGDRAHGHVRAVHLPVRLLREHIDESIIEQLVRDKVLVLGAEHVQIQPHALKQLDQQWYRFLINQLPTGQGRTSADAAAAARAVLETAVTEILNEDLQVTVRVNGRTNTIERVEFSVWGIRTDLLHEHQVTWKNLKLLVIKEGVAIVKPAGIAALSDATKERLHALYLVQSGRSKRDESDAADNDTQTLPTAKSQADPATSDGASAHAAAAPVPEPPLETPSGAEADDPLNSAPRVKCVPILTSSASAPPFRVPGGVAAAQSGASAAKIDVSVPAASPAVMPARRTATRHVAPEGTSAAVGSQEGAPSRAPRREATNETPARAPRAAGLTTVSSPRRGARDAARAARAGAAAVASTPLVTGLGVTRLPHRGVTAVRVPAEGEVAQRTRDWYRKHEKRLSLVFDIHSIAPHEHQRQAGRVLVGFGEAAHIVVAARATQGLGCPKRPAAALVQPTKIGNTLAYDAFRVRLHDAPVEWGLWIAQNAARLTGHPRFDPNQPPLANVEYRPALLYVPPGDAADILGQPVDADLHSTTALGPLVALDISELPPATNEPARASV